MASIYREGAGWSARVRMNGKSVYKGGFDSQKSAKKWAREQETELDEQKASRVLPAAQIRRNLAA